MGTAHGKQISGSFALLGHLHDHRDVAWRAPNNGKSVERTVESRWSSDRLERGGVVLDGTRQFGSKHHFVGQIDHSTSTRRGFQSVGCMDHFRGRFTKELAECELAAWRRFYANWKLLCDNNVALKYRLCSLTSCVVSSMYWCSWILISTQCTHQRAAQDRMLRKMICVTPRGKR